MTPGAAELPADLKRLERMAHALSERTSPKLLAIGALDAAKTLVRPYLPLPRVGPDDPDRRDEMPWRLLEVVRNLSTNLQLREWDQAAVDCAHIMDIRKDVETEPLRLAHEQRREAARAGAMRTNADSAAETAANRGKCMAIARPIAERQVSLVRMASWIAGEIRKEWKRQQGDECPIEKNTLRRWLGEENWYDALRHAKSVEQIGTRGNSSASVGVKHVRRNERAD